MDSVADGFKNSNLHPFCCSLPNSNIPQVSTRYSTPECRNDLQHDYSDNYQTFKDDRQETKHSMVYSDQISSIKASSSCVSLTDFEGCRKENNENISKGKAQRNIECKSLERGEQDNSMEVSSSIPQFFAAADTMVKDASQVKLPMEQNEVLVCKIT